MYGLIRNVGQDVYRVSMASAVRQLWSDQGLKGITGRTQSVKPIEQRQQAARSWLSAVHEVRVLSQTSVAIVRLVEANGTRFVVKTSIAGCPTSVQSVVREAEWLARHQHPGIVRVIASETNCSTPWFAMPWYDPSKFGLDPQATGQMQPCWGLTGKTPDCLKTLRHVADTLAWLHGRGIVHRDLKPDNIRLDDTGLPVLIDFGIYCRTARGREKIARRLSYGTRAFAAPEQLRGEAVDGRSDTYALGKLLLLSLSGEMVRSGSGSLQLKEAERCLTTVPSVSTEMRNLTLALLEPEPQLRTTYAADVAHILEHETGELSRKDLPKASPFLYRASLCGRARVLSQLASELDCLRSGRGNVLIVKGTSGSGKTRALQALAELAWGSPVDVFSSSCRDLGLNGHGSRTLCEPLHAWRPLLRHLAERTSPDCPTLAPLLRRHASLLEKFDPSMSSWLDPDAADYPGDVAPEQVRAAVLSLVHAAAAERPCLFLLDDVQQADELSLGVLKDLAANPRIAPCCGVVMAEVNEGVSQLPPELGSAIRYREVTLEELDAAETQQMVLSMLGGGHVSSEFTEAVHAQTAGNPQVIAAYLEYLIRTETLQRSGPFWIPVWGVPPQMPLALKELLSRRLTELQPSAHRLIAAGAVLGRTFDLQLAATISKLPFADAMNAVAQLRALHIVEDLGNWSLSFSHECFFELSYESINCTERTQYHRQAAVLLQKSGEGSSSELARHNSAAGKPAQAFVHFLRASTLALDRGLCQQAELYLEKALAAHARLTQPMSLSDTARVTTLQARTALSAHNYVAAGQHAAEGLAKLGSEVPDSTRGWLLALLVALARQVSLRLRKSSSHAPGSKPVLALCRARAYLNHALATSLRYENKVAGALVCQIRSANEAELARDWKLASLSTAVMGCAMGFMGLRRLAHSYFERATAWGRTANSLQVQIFCDTVEAYYLLNSSTPQAAQQVATRNTKGREESGTSEFLLLNWGVSALIAFRSGKMTQARHYTALLTEQTLFGDSQQSTAEGRLVHHAIGLRDGLVKPVARESLAMARSLRQTGGTVFRCCALAIAAAALARRAKSQAVEACFHEIYRLMPDGGAGNFSTQFVHLYLPEAMLRGAAYQRTPEQRLRWLQLAQQAITAAQAHARRMPSSRAAVAYHRAQLATFRGKRHRAYALSQYAVTLAQEHTQPFEEACARALAASLNTEDTIRAVEVPGTIFVPATQLNGPRSEHARG